MICYQLIKKDGTTSTFYGFSDLCNAFIDEYGYIPGYKNMIQEGFDIFYHGS